jgi:Domain of unknown function (DUF4112)
MESQGKLGRMTAELPIGTDATAVRRRIEALEQLLEGAFVIPGLNMRVGFDAVLGLIPVAGDAIAAGLGLYLVWEAKNLGLPRWQLWRMAANVGIDGLIGAVPVAGDLFDFVYKSNTRNLRIVRKHLDKHHPASVTISA